jgi:hypothetical protein
MQILHSLILKDYFLTMDFFIFLSLDPIFMVKYKQDVQNLLNTDNIIVPLKTILSKFNYDLGYKINEMETGVKNNSINIELKFESLFDTLYSTSDYTDEIKYGIKNFYEKYYNESIYVNAGNIFDILNKPIKLEFNKYLQNDYIKLCSNTFYEFNNSIIQHIITNFNTQLLRKKISYDHTSYFYLKKKLFIFMKVISKDFTKILDEPIHKDDPFCVMFVKVNRDLFRLIRIELLDVTYLKSIDMSLIKNNDLLILLFILCYSNNENMSLIDYIGIKFKNKEKIYCDRSVSLHASYKSIFV